MLFDRPLATRRHPASGVAGAVLVHLVLAALAVFAVRSAPEGTAAAAAEIRPPAQMVWVPSNTAAGGGGGGGGNRRSEPPRRTEAPGRDRLTIQPAPTAAPAPSTAPRPEPEQTLALSAAPLASGVAPLIGVIEPAAPPSHDATGPGDGPGADGPAGGPGSGPGRGPGVGPGLGGEMGDIGPPGNGVSWPRLVRDVRPAYTADAMRARITGRVGLSCVVDRDGSVRDCRLTRSLDRRHGLDEAALAAAAQWRFEPARRHAEPVPVRVAIDMDFSLR